jgi:hypothetical protein
VRKESNTICVVRVMKVLREKGNLTLLNEKIIMFLRSDFYYEGPTATREHLQKLALNSRIFHHERKLSIRSHLKGCGSMVGEKNKKKYIRKVISLGNEDKRVL